MAAEFDDDNDDIMQRILGRKSVMGKRKTTRLLNSIAAGYLDEDKYPLRHARAAPAASLFISAGSAFFDGRSADCDGGAASAPAASDEGVTADEEEHDAAAYETEKELADMLRRSGAETSTLHKFQCIQRRIRHELKRVQDLSFLSSLERYLTSFKFDELDPGHEFDGGDAFRICSAAELGVDMGGVPAPMRPLFLELFSPYHRILAHGVCQFHQLSSKSTDLRGRRITVIKRALVLPPAAGSVASLCRFLVEIRTLKSERLARVRERRSKGGKYAAFARRFGEFKDDEQSVHSDEADDLEVGSPPRARRAAKGRAPVAASSRARREAEAAAAEADLEEDLHERFRERFSIRR